MRRRRQPPRPLVSESTSEISLGPVNFNAADARRCGWTEKMINRAYERIEAVIRKEQPIARRRRPDLYRTLSDGTVIYVGETPDGPALTRAQKLQLGVRPNRRQIISGRSWKRK